MECKRPAKDVSTTSRLCYQYKPSEIQQKFHFHQLPSIELHDESKLPQRQFPIEPAGPQRHWEPGWDQGMRCNIRYFIDKPILRSDPPQLTNTSRKPALHFGDSRTSKRNTDSAPWSATLPALPRNKLSSEDLGADHPMRTGGEDTSERNESESDFEAEEGEKEEERVEEDVDGDLKEGSIAGLSPEDITRLAIRAFWTSTTRRMTEEACLPVPKVRVPTTTLERNADLVKYRPHRYDSTPAYWQKVAPPVWDRLQQRAGIRPNMSYPSPVPGPSMQSCPMPPIPRPKSGRLEENKEKTIFSDSRIKDLINCERLTSTYMRQCPGYAGYRPRSPLRIPMENLHEPNLRMMTTMRASYRPRLVFPPLGLLQSPHMGPMSRTVTLTYPYNPFNKVERRQVYGRNDV